MTTAQGSRRERAIEALSRVLGDIDGVVRVKRQAVTKELLSSHEIPGVVVDEAADRLAWFERHNGRNMDCRAIVVLDCQVQGAEGKVSTAREAIKWLVINRLCNNPTLTTQLDDEDEPQAHCSDCASKFDVRYVEEQFPYGRVMITMEVHLEEVFDDREVTEWSQLILSCGPSEDETKHITSVYSKEQNDG
ncbi:MAG: hypothetical protein ACF8MF_06830 [Phycisphaerales bacterium JB052]